MKSISSSCKHFDQSHSLLIKGTSFVNIFNPLALDNSTDKAPQNLTGRQEERLILTLSVQQPGDFMSSRPSRGCWMIHNQVTRAEHQSLSAVYPSESSVPKQWYCQRYSQNGSFLYLRLIFSHFIMLPLFPKAIVTRHTVNAELLAKPSLRFLI